MKELEQITKTKEEIQQTINKIQHKLDEYSKTLPNDASEFFDKIDKAIREYFIKSGKTILPDGKFNIEFKNGEVKITPIL